MLSSNTYAIWNTLVGIFAVLMGLSNANTGGMVVYTVLFFVVALVFFVFAFLAYKNRSIYAKHPVTWKSNGEPEVKNDSEDNRRNANK